jgi:hypothetical protein
MTRFDHAAVGDQERLLKTELECNFTKTRDRTGSEDDARARLEIEWIHLVVVADRGWCYFVCFVFFVDGFMRNAKRVP